MIISSIRDQSEFKLEGGGGGGGKNGGSRNFLEEYEGGPEICLFGLIASNRTIIL